MKIIEQVGQVMGNSGHQNHVVEVAATISGASAVVGTTIGQVNQILQTIAYIVSIISGLCAIAYYVTRRNK